MATYKKRKYTKKAKVEQVEPKEKVEHPLHYNLVPGVECIDVVENFNFNRGNAIKYIWRAGNKEEEMEDLRKAVWYLQREIDRISKS